MNRIVWRLFTRWVLLLAAIATILGFLSQFAKDSDAQGHIGGLFAGVQSISICRYGPTSNIPGQNCKEAVGALSEINAWPESVAESNAAAACEYWGLRQNPSVKLTLHGEKSFKIDPRPLTCAGKFDASDWNGKAFENRARWVCKNPGSSPVLTDITCVERSEGLAARLLLYVVCLVVLLVLLGRVAKKYWIQREKRLE